MPDGFLTDVRWRNHSLAMSAPLVVGLGEILWDVFPDGAKFGGAPANFAVHCAALGADVSMVSAVGQDQLGDRAIEGLRSRNVSTDFVQQPDFPTGTVDVQVDSGGHASYVFAPNTAWDNLVFTDELRAQAERTDVVCFGSLGQRSPSSRMTICKFVEATRKDALRIFDVNLRQNFYSDEVIRLSLEISNVLKLNDEEVDTVRRGDGSQIERLKDVREKFELQLVALTRGEDGAVLITESEVIECAGVPTEVVDTVGAGDAFTAALAMGLFGDVPLRKIGPRASELASYVCSQKGATPELPDELKSLFGSENG
ncbi:MAG: carbohydrate kinase [Verrucomicrobiales bacterium]|nr:carbohydrate kinase [Verrucomicrobiales bacterium]